MMTYEEQEKIERLVAKDENARRLPHGSVADLS